MKKTTSQVPINTTGGKVGIASNFFTINFFDLDDYFVEEEVEEEIVVLKGQVWRHKTYPDVTGQILSVDTPAPDNVELIIVGRKPGEKHNWNLGHSFTFNYRKDLVANWELYKDVSSGATCVKCKEFYPYANPIDNFRCYACRNGLK